MSTAELLRERLLYVNGIHAENIPIEEIALVVREAERVSASLWGDLGCVIDHHSEQLQAAIDDLKRRLEE